MHYKWSPLPSRKPLKWPNGKRLAVILTVNLEYWEMIKDTKEAHYAGGPPMILDPVPGNVADFPNFSWREYGQRAGVWRVFDVFAKSGVQTTATMNALTALKRPEIIKTAVDMGMELVAHGWEQGELLHKLSPDVEKQRKLIREVLAVYEKAVGKKAKGWLSSSLRGTPEAIDICAEEGLIYYCDLMNDDQPYLIETPSRPIVSVPYVIEINDFSLFIRRGLTTSAGLEEIKEQFDVLYAESAETGKLMNLGVHPHVIGQPFRIRALRDFIEHAKKHEGVWFATREEIATWYLQNHQSHIPPG